MKTFEKEQTVYDINGREYEFVVEVPGVGFCVRPLFGGDEEEPAWGEALVLPKVFHEAPKERWAKNVEEAEQELAELDAKVEAARKELAELTHKGRKEELLKELSQIKALERIEQFMRGSITHYVEYDYDYKIAKRGERKDRDDEPNKLLVLFGKSNGKLEWGLNQYADGSGSGYHTVWPCESEEEARVVLQQQVEDAVTNWRTTGKAHEWHAYSLSAAQRAAQAYNLPFPEDAVAFLKAETVKCAQATVTAKKAEYDKAVAKLTELGEPTA